MHTPGPWKVAKGGQLRIMADKENLAVVYWGGLWDKPYPGKENARLIAAAPDLLAALEETRAYVKYCMSAYCDAFNVDEARADLAMIDAALAKANGV